MCKFCLTSPSTLNKGKINTTCSQNLLIMYNIKYIDKSLPNFYLLCESPMWTNVKHKLQNNFKEMTPPFTLFCWKPLRKSHRLMLMLLMIKKVLKKLGLPSICFSIDTYFHFQLIMCEIHIFKYLYWLPEWFWSQTTKV